KYLRCWASSIARVARCSWWSRMHAWPCGWRIAPTCWRRVASCSAARPTSCSAIPRSNVATSACASWSAKRTLSPARGVIKGEGWHNALAMPDLAVGDTAPDFELPVRGRETVKLSEALQRGPVVLLTYIFDFSPG